MTKRKANRTEAIEQVDFKNTAKTQWERTGIVGMVDPRLAALKKTHTSYSRRIAIFGIDKYQIGEEASLAGCVNDANDIANTLRYLGWPASGIHVITNERATSYRFLEELEWLVDGADRGDVRGLAISSHGGNKIDWDGDEIDGVDEMPIFNDFSWEHEDTHITDDVIRNNLVSKVDKQAKLDIVLDTCHSGTGARSLFGVRRTDAKARYLPNPDQQFMINRVSSYDGLRRRWFGNSNVDREIAGDATYNNGTLYACKDYQLAYETVQIENGVSKVRGLMTYNLCNILRETTGIITRAVLGEAIASKVAAESDQIPGYECSNLEFLNQIPFTRLHQDEIGEL